MTENKAKKYAVVRKQRLASLRTILPQVTKGEELLSTNVITALFQAYTNEFLPTIDPTKPWPITVSGLAKQIPGVGFSGAMHIRDWIIKNGGVFVTENKFTTPKITQAIAYLQARGYTVTFTWENKNDAGRKS